MTHMAITQKATTLAICEFSDRAGMRILKHWLRKSVLALYIYVPPNAVCCRHTNLSTNHKARTRIKYYERLSNKVLAHLCQPSALP